MQKPESDFDALRDDLRQVYDGDPCLKPADLARMVGDQRNPSAGTGKTVGSHIRGILQHHTYHQGQIAQLKKAASS